MKEAVTKDASFYCIIHIHIFMYKVELSKRYFFNALMHCAKKLAQCINCANF